MYKGHDRWLQGFHLFLQCGQGTLASWDSGGLVTLHIADEDTCVPVPDSGGGEDK